MLQTVRAEKVDEKMGPFVQIPCFLAKLWSLNYPKNVHFLQFCAVLSKKPESVKTTCKCASESSHYTLSANDTVYRGLSHRS